MAPPAGNSTKTAPGRPFQKGQSGNPSGRPKSVIGELIREATGDGRLLVESALKVLKGEPLKRKADDGTESEVWPAFHDMADARDWLADRGWGKAVQSVDHTTNGEALSFRIERAK